MAVWHGTQGCESVECWTHVVTFNVHLNHDLDLGFSRSNFLIAIYRNARAHRHQTKVVWVDMTLTLDFQGKILKLLYLSNGRVDSLGMKGMWVGYDVGCTMGLTLGHSAWQIDRPSNGSLWNSYSFHPVGQWVGNSFTDLGAEGCCRSLNALLSLLIFFQFGRLKRRRSGGHEPPRRPPPSRSPPPRQEEEDDDDDDDDGDISKYKLDSDDDDVRALIPVMESSKSLNLVEWASTALV